MNKYTVSRSSQAFTMIELLLATSIGIVVMLMAVTVYRSATAAMASLNAEAQLSQTLRAGYYAAMADVDYWHSHADPDFPYLRELHSQYRADAVVQPSFAKVSLDGDDADFNTNWMAPHDPRNWYRGYLLSNLRSKGPDDGNGDAPGAQRWNGILEENEVVVMHEYVSSIEGMGIPAHGRQTIGAGLSPRTLHGDYGLLGNILGPGTGDTSYSSITSALTTDPGNYAALVSSQRDRTVMYQLAKFGQRAVLTGILPPQTHLMLRLPSANDRIHDESGDVPGEASYNSGVSDRPVWLRGYFFGEIPFENGAQDMSHIPSDSSVLPSVPSYTDLQKAGIIDEVLDGMRMGSSYGFSTSSTTSGQAMLDRLKVSPDENSPRIIGLAGAHIAAYALPQFDDILETSGTVRSINHNLIAVTNTFLKRPFIFNNNSSGSVLDIGKYNTEFTRARTQRLGYSFISSPNKSEFGNTVLSGDAERGFINQLQWSSQMMDSRGLLLPNYDTDGGTKVNMAITGNDSNRAKFAILNQGKAETVTSWLPLIPQDMLDVVSNDATSGTELAVGVKRYSLGGADRIRLRIDAGVDGAGSRTLRFFAIGSCYRGARQHWGMLTKGTTREMGDIYE